MGDSRNNGLPVKGSGPKFVAMTIGLKGGIGKTAVSATTYVAAKEFFFDRVALFDADTINRQLAELEDDVKVLDFRAIEYRGPLKNLAKRLQSGELEAAVIDTPANLEQETIDEMIDWFSQELDRVGVKLCILMPITTSSFVQRKAVEFVKKHPALPVVLIDMQTQGRKAAHLGRWRQTQALKDCREMGAATTFMSDAGVEHGDEAAGYRLTIADVAQGDFAKAGKNAANAAAVFNEDVQAHLAIWLEENIERFAFAILLTLGTPFLRGDQGSRMTSVRRRAAELIARGARPERGRTLLRIEEQQPEPPRRGGGPPWLVVSFGMVMASCVTLAALVLVAMLLTTPEQRGTILTVLADPPMTPKAYATCQALGQDTLRPVVDALTRAPQKQENTFGAGWITPGRLPLVDLNLSDALILLASHLAAAPAERRAEFLARVMVTASILLDTPLRSLFERLARLPEELRAGLLAVSDEELAALLERLNAVRVRDGENRRLADRLSQAERHQEAERQRLLAGLEQLHGKAWLTPTCLREIEALPFRRPSQAPLVSPRRRYP